jgi:TolB-like protein
MTDLTGQTLGPYRVVEQIGAGGMGVVYRAHDERLARDVAIKVLPEDLACNQDRLARFETEAKAVARLAHPNILEIWDFGTAAGVTYAVTELLEGEPLRARIAPTGLGWQKASEVAAAIAEGLAAAHDKDIVHRDLKPENVFLTSDGRVKILDFGLAQIREPVDESAETATLTPDGTVPGTVMGTMGYMSPEQVRGEPSDARSDVFALGCVLYEMLTGRPAFVRKSAAETTAAILKEEPPALTGLADDLPAGLDRIVRRCMEKSRGARFQSASDLGFALQQMYSAQSGAAAARDPDRIDGAEKPSIAVLPFDNLSGDAEQEYFCDGMAEEIINALVRVEGLRVVARTSSFAFKGKHLDIREIGEMLDVCALLEGSVRKAGDRLRITAQLINVADGFHLWSERFDRTLEDIFAIQDEIALAIVEKLSVELLGHERADIVKRPTENLDAYNAYLQGMYQWNRLTPDGYEQSLRCYEEAIDLDGEFGQAYAQLAIWHLSQAFWGAVSPTESGPKSLELAARAMAIDDRISEAHSFMGVVSTFFERNPEVGEHHLRRAIELGPNVAVNHSNLAAMLTAQGKFEEAFEAAQMTKRLDPLSPTNNAWASWWIGLGGRVEQAISDLEKLIALEPNHWLPHHVLGDLNPRQGKLQEAISESRRAVELSGRISICLAQLSYVSFLAGETDEAMRNLAILEKRSQESYVPPTFFAWIHHARQETDLALKSIEEAARVNDPWISFYRVTHQHLPFDPKIEQAARRYSV